MIKFAELTQIAAVYLFATAGLHPKHGKLLFSRGGGEDGSRQLPTNLSDILALVRVLSMACKTSPRRVVCVPAVSMPLFGSQSQSPSVLFVSSPFTAPPLVPTLRMLKSAGEIASL